MTLNPERTRDVKLSGKDESDEEAGVLFQTGFVVNIMLRDMVH